MDKFIYVFCAESRDAMIKKGYKILKNDTKRNIYIFQNSENLKFDKLDFSFITSNTLTF